VLVAEDAVAEEDGSDEQDRRAPAGCLSGEDALPLDDQRVAGLFDGGPQVGGADAVFVVDDLDGAALEIRVRAFDAGESFQFALYGRLSVAAAHALYGEGLLGHVVSSLRVTGLYLRAERDPGPGHRGVTGDRHEAEPPRHRREQRHGLHPGQLRP